jgi:hypothetical protein
LGGKSTGRTCTICSERFNQKSLGMKYLILMAARRDDKGFEIADCRLWIVDFGIQEFRDLGI